MKPYIFSRFCKEQNRLRSLCFVYVACFCIHEKTRSKFLKTCSNYKYVLNQVLINVDLVSKRTKSVKSNKGLEAEQSSESHKSQG